MLWRCASPQLMPHALCWLEVANGTIVRTYSGPKKAYSKTNMPPMEPPTAAAICFTPRSSRTSLCMLERISTVQAVRHAISVLHVVSDRGQGKLWAIPLAVRISVNCCDRAGTAIWTTQAIETDNKEPRHVKGPSRATHQGSPPIRHISAPRQGMAYDKGIVPLRRQPSTRTVCDWDVAKSDA